MPRTQAFLASLAAVVSLAGAIGCSSSSPTDGPAAATCDPSTTVSFKNDVMPIFPGGCSLTMSCHGQPNNVGEESLFLGHGIGDGTNSAADIMTVYMGLVGVKSIENPDMDLVATGGDLENSFLWHKINGDMNSDPTVVAGCKKAVAANTNVCSDCATGTECGSYMPYDGTLLANDVAPAPAHLCTIKNWIAEGAPNN
jgi:hypothetical protein